MDARFSVASLFSAYTSLTAIFTLFEQFYYKFVPEILRNYIALKLKLWIDKSSKDQESFTLIINEYDDESYKTLNFLYQACLLYLSDKLRSKTTRLQGSRENLNQKSVTYRLAQGETFVETLEKVGIDLQWKFLCKNVRGEEDDTGKTKSIHLSFDIAYRSEVLDCYLPSVVIKYHDDIIALKKDIFLYTYEGMGSWKPVKFNHPFTFDSLALDPELKQSIIDDLNMFIRRKAFYNKVGRAWKRGYLLYGPPGTGKSSLIAAMANHLRFNIYDLQLGAVDNDFTLRKLMLSTRNKSILVIEDIDCTMGLSRAAPKAFRECGDEHKRQGHQNSNEGNVNNGTHDTQLSLSGLLNFIDGLWSSCGDERIIVFTTNHKEQLDPALLRPGRMDMHIHMSYLTMKGFKILVNNYLGFPWEHPLFREIEPLLETLNVTPAQVAEELIRNEDPNIALFRVVDMLIKKRSMQIQQCQEISRVEPNVNERQMESQESSGQGKVNERQMECQENKESNEKKSRGEGKVKERQMKCQENKEDFEKRVSNSMNGKKESSGVGFFKRMRKKVVNKKIHQ